MELTIILLMKFIDYKLFSEEPGKIAYPKVNLGFF